MSKGSITDKDYMMENNVGNDEEDDSKIFPQRLMGILAEERNQDAICWLPHGRAFIIRNRKLFAETVMPRYFSRKAKYSSFTRKLNRWNFVRISSGPELGAYHHEFFLRDKPHLAAQMFCKNARTMLAMASSSASSNTSNSNANSNSNGNGYSNSNGNGNGNGYSNSNSNGNGCSNNNSSNNEATEDSKALPPVATATATAIAAASGAASSPKPPLEIATATLQPLTASATAGVAAAASKPLRSQELLPQHQHLHQNQQRQNLHQQQQQGSVFPSELLAAYCDKMGPENKANNEAAFAAVAPAYNNLNALQMLEQQMLFLQHQQEQAKRIFLEMQMQQQQQQQTQLRHHPQGQAQGQALGHRMQHQQDLQQQQQQQQQHIQMQAQAHMQQKLPPGLQQDVRVQQLRQLMDMRAKQQRGRNPNNSRAHAA